MRCVIVLVFCNGYKQDRLHDAAVAAADDDDEVLKLPRRQNSMKFFRVDSSVKM
jgi:hypothetical protein